MTKLYIKFLISLYLSLSMICPVYGQKIIFEKTEKIKNISNKAYFFEDKTAKLTFSDILKEENKYVFRPILKTIPNFLTAQSVIWCELYFENKSDQKCFLEIESATIQELEFYYEDQDGKFLKKTTGFYYPFESRSFKSNFYLFELHSDKPNQTKTFYLKFKSEKTLNIPMSIGIMPAFMEKKHKTDLFYGIYIGLLLVIVLYNVLLFLAIRDIAFLYYVFYVISLGLINLWLNVGLAFEYLWPDYPIVNKYVDVWEALLCITLILFSGSFLNTRKHIPKIGWYFSAFYAASFIVMIFSLSGLYYLSSMISQITIWSLFVFLFFVGFISYKKGIKTAFFYIIALGVFLTSGIIYLLYTIAILPAIPIIKNSLVIGSSIEAILLSIALADRIYTLRKERNDFYTEKIQLIKNQKESLEKEVYKRTEKILAQNEELQQQQEEIMSQRDKLMLQNSQLNEAHSLINEQNTSLQEYNDNLNHLIEQKTEELAKTNHQLIQYNHQLEQFAYVTVHDLRSPVVRIKGLSSIMDLNKVKDHETKYLIVKMIESAFDLDSIIKELNNILEIRKGADEVFENINPKHILDLVKNSLVEEISKTGTEIISEIPENFEFKSYPGYIQSIIYHLIHNSIKFRHPDRPPVIEICVREEKNQIIISIQDNGLGINIERYKDQLFGLYKRFHGHVKGRGLGLHLVKTQVDVIGGQIELISTENKGAKFILKLVKHI